MIAPEGSLVFHEKSQVEPADYKGPLGPNWK
nr:phosphatidylinositol transfer protein beta isoform CAST1 - bovine (fragments) [Bos taurus]